MCDTCGCGDPERVPVEVHDRILAVNDRTAGHNREHFAGRGVLAVNVMGSPGSGKTALLEATARALAGRARLGAVSGDLETHRDAERLNRAGIPSRAITTGSACHLDAEMVHHALHGIDLDGLDYFFVENVGNLVCPAVYDLGEDARVVALSVTEGEDKPLKYPVMFRKTDLVVLTKTDLTPHLDVREDVVEEAVRQVAPRAGFLKVSARTGDGLDGWLAWLAKRRDEARARSGAAWGSAAHAHHHDHGHVHGHEG